MDKYHIALFVLLVISISFLGFSSISKNNQTFYSSTETDVREPEVWSTKITPDDLNNIADKEWIARLKAINNSYITGSDKICLNICGIRCLWLGYSYKDHGVFQGSFLWGDKENFMCSCDCYVDTRQ